MEFYLNFQFNNLATRDTCKESQGKRNPDVTNELLVVIYLTYGIHVSFFHFRYTRYAPLSPLSQSLTLPYLLPSSFSLVSSSASPSPKTLLSQSRRSSIISAF